MEKQTCGALVALGLSIAGIHTPLVAQAQRITIAVAIDDSAANRVFKGAFTTAFRALGDVDVVSPAERPQYVLSGVVLCTPTTCEDPSYYTASLRLWSPIGEFTARAIALRTVPRLPAVTRVRRVDSVATRVISPLLKGYETTHQTWVVEWGRQRYEQAVREFVRRIDAECFERSRAYDRAIATTDTVLENAILATIESRSWLC